MSPPRTEREKAARVLQEQRGMGLHVSEQFVEKCTPDEVNTLAAYYQLPSLQQVLTHIADRHADEEAAKRPDLSILSEES